MLLFWVAVMRYFISLFILTIQSMINCGLKIQDFKPFWVHEILTKVLQLKLY